MKEGTALTDQPLILFDWDGTLADSMPLCIAEVRTALARMGLPDPGDAVLRQCNGPSIQESLPILGIPPERCEEYLAARLDACYTLCPQVNRLYPGIQAMLETLRQRAALCIVSNGAAAYLDRCREVFHLDDSFIRIDPFHPGSTKTQSVAALLKELRPARAIMVGDRQGDILAGRDNGLPTLCAAYGYGAPEEWALADRVARDVPELTRMLETWVG